MCFLYVFSTKYYFVSWWIKQHRPLICVCGEDKDDISKYIKLGLTTFKSSEMV